MARNKKSVLNQVSEEPVVKKEVVEEPKELIEQVTESTIEEPVEEIKMEVPVEKPIEVVFTNDPIEIDLLGETEEAEEQVEEDLEDEAEEEAEEESYEEKKARFLNNKTSSPYRLYLRTGIIPKL